MANTISRSASGSALIAVLWLFAAPAESAETASDLHARATKLYDAGKIAQACPLFAKVTQLEPENAQAWADLGLCEFKNARKEQSRAASARALRLGDAKTRLGAAFNLLSAGSAVAVSPGKCVDVAAPSELECSERARVCATEECDPGTRDTSEPVRTRINIARCTDAACGDIDRTRQASFNARAREKPAELSCCCDSEGNRHPCRTQRRTTSCELIAVDPCRGRAWIRCTEDVEPCREGLTCISDGGTTRETREIEFQPAAMR